MLGCQPWAQCTLTIAVLVLDYHVVVLCPGRVVAHDVGVVSQHGVGIHLPQGQLPGGHTGDKLRWQAARGYQAPGEEPCFAASMSWTPLFPLSLRFWQTDWLSQLLKQNLPLLKCPEQLFNKRLALQLFYLRGKGSSSFKDFALATGHHKLVNTDESSAGHTARQGQQYVCQINFWQLL